MKINQDKRKKDANAMEATTKGRNIIEKYNREI